jgi:hypothetical protein
MSITCSIASFVPRVKDHRGYEQMIFDIDVFLEFTDTETGSTIGYQLFHRFDTEFEYNDETPFVPFYDITEEQLYNWIEEWKSAEVTYDGKNLTQWAEDKFASIYAEPKPAFFAWQTVPPVSELHVDE